MKLPDHDAAAATRIVAAVLAAQLAHTHESAAIIAGTLTDAELRALPGVGRKLIGAYTRYCQREGRAHIVSRHAGAIDWVRRTIGIDAPAWAHIGAEPGALALDHVRRGDRLIGVLPLEAVPDLSGRGVTCDHISIPGLPAAARGRELSADEMCGYGARLIRVSATIHAPQEEHET